MKQTQQNHMNVNIFAFLWTTIDNQEPICKIFKERIRQSSVYIAHTFSMRDFECVKNLTIRENFIMEKCQEKHFNMDVVWEEIVPIFFKK